MVLESEERGGLEEARVDARVVGGRGADMA